MQSVAVGGVVFIGGGHANYVDYEFIILSYNSSTGMWKKLPKYSARRFAMATVEGVLVLVGGCNHGYEDVDSIGVWDALQKEWTNPFPALPTCRSDSSAVGYKQWLLVAGGMCNGYCIEAVEVLDTSSSGYWMSVSPTPIAWTAMRSVVVEDTWFLLGGQTAENKGASKLFSVSVTSLLTHASNKYSEARAISHSEAYEQELWAVSEGFGYELATPVCVGGFLCAVGGLRGNSLTNDNTGSCGMYRFCPFSKTWSKVGLLPTLLYNCTCSIMSSGQMLLAGGYHNTVMKQFVSISKAVYLGNILAPPT